MANHPDPQTVLDHLDGGGFSPNPDVEALGVHLGVALAWLSGDDVVIASAGLFMVRGLNLGIEFLTLQ